MSSKTIIGGVVAVLVIAGGAAAYLMTKDTSNNKSTSNTSKTQSTAKEKGRSLVDKVTFIAPHDADACDVLTAAVATSLGGNGMTKADATTYQTPSIPGETKASSCAYENSTSYVNVTVKVALSEGMAKANANEFVDYESNMKTTVNGYGDAAYYDKSDNSLHMLANNNIYTMSGYLNKTEPNIDDTKKIAEAVKANL